MNQFLYVNDILRQAVITIRAGSSYNGDTSSDIMIEALYKLNSILAILNANQSQLPYAIKFEFNLTAPNNTYIVGNSTNATVVTTPFTDIAFINLLLEGISYPVEIQDDFAFFNPVLIPAITGRPTSCRLNKGQDNTTIQFYPSPDRTYVCQIFGKKPVGQINFQDYVDLPNYYREMLVLELAWKINSLLNLGNWSPDLEKQRLEAKQVVLNTAKRDLRIRSSPPFYHYDTFYSGRLGVTS